MMSTKKYIRIGLIGHPVAQSPSPRIHAHWMAQHAIAGAYEAVDVPPGGVRDAVQALAGKGFIGLNVTVPHKVEALGVCDDTSHTARSIGAVNTLLMRGGRIYGENTDSYGFSAALPPLGPAPALVLGAGGAARGGVHALAALGVPEIRVAARRPEAIEALRPIAPVTPAPWPAPAWALADIGLLVNTTSLGMAGQPPLPVDLTPLPHPAIVCDIVYKPLYTDLLLNAAARGNPVVTGIGMLLHQAARAFALWHGLTPAVTPALERAVLAG
jgi:shikimate dehydrogenase